GEGRASVGRGDTRPVQGARTVAGDRRQDLEPPGVDRRHPAGSQRPGGGGVSASAGGPLTATCRLATSANPFLLPKLRDAAFRADRPAFTTCGEADAIVIFSVEPVPRGAVVPRNVGARRAHRDPTVVRPGHGGAEGKALVDEMPG